MDIVKIIGIGFIALIIIVIIKQYKPEFAMYVSIIAGTIIIFLSLDKIIGIINLLKNSRLQAFTEPVNGSYCIFFFIFPVTHPSRIPLHCLSLPALRRW